MRVTRPPVNLVLFACEFVIVWAIAYGADQLVSHRPHVPSLVYAFFATIALELLKYFLSPRSTVFQVQGEELVARSVGILRHTYRFPMRSIQYRIETPARMKLLPETWNLRLLDAQGHWIDVLRGYQSHELVEVAAELQALV